MKFGKAKLEAEEIRKAALAEAVVTTELSFFESLLLRTNVNIKDKTEMQDLVGRHVYVIHNDDRPLNKQYFRGDILAVRDVSTWYGKDKEYMFKVGPLGSLNPSDFNLNVLSSDVFILPKSKEDLIEEYNRLISATEQILARIEYMEATNKSYFDEKIYLADKTLTDLYALWGQPEVGDTNNIAEKENKIKDFLRKAIKI